MGNSKLMIGISILIFWLDVGYKIKDETKTGITTEHQTNIEQNSNVHYVDSTSFIIRSIDDVFIKYKLKYEIIEDHADNKYEYVFKIISLKNAELHLLKETFDAEDEAIIKIGEIKEEKEREPMIKIFNFIFRKDNIVYSINSTENISHIRVEIYDYLLEYFNVSQSDKILY